MIWAIGRKRSNGWMPINQGIKRGDNFPSIAQVNLGHPRLDGVRSTRQRLFADLGYDNSSPK